MFENFFEFVGIEKREDANSPEALWDRCFLNRSRDEERKIAGKRL